MTVTAVTRDAAQLTRKSSRTLQPEESNCGIRQPQSQEASVGDIEMVYKISLDDVLLLWCLVSGALGLLVALCLGIIVICEKVKRRIASMSELRDLIPLAFPTLIIMLSAAAGIVYLLYGDWRRGLYWLLAAGLGGCVTW